MVLLTITGSAVRQLFDQHGSPIGTVIRPVANQTVQMVGRGAGTVLLTRSAGPALHPRLTEPAERGLDLRGA